MSCESQVVSSEWVCLCVCVCVCVSLYACVCVCVCVCLCVCTIESESECLLTLTSDRSIRCVTGTSPPADLSASNTQRMHLLPVKRDKKCVFVLLRALVGYWDVRWGGRTVKVMGWNSNVLMETIPRLTPTCSLIMIMYRIINSKLPWIKASA